VEYYVEYIQAVRQLSRDRLKYCDESHFSSRELRQARGWSPKGEVLEVEGTSSISESYSITLATSHVGSPFYLSSPREGTNTSIDFLKFVLELICAKFLSSGDIFVLDNSAIHYAEAIQSTLDEILDANGISMYFLPKYSPELNPCELVFAQSKGWLRCHRDSDLPFVFEIAASFAHVTAENFRNFYDGCLNLRVK